MRIVLNGMGGELETDLPFKLVHPRPGILDELLYQFLHDDNRVFGNESVDIRKEVSQGKKERSKNTKIPCSGQCSQRNFQRQPGMVSNQ